MAITPSLLLTLALAGCGRDKSDASSTTATVPTAAADRPSLILVTLDTTRADIIGAYGSELAAPTPTLDGLAAEGVRFARAYATVPLTTPAHSSMLSGLYPPRHGVHTNGDAILPESATTLAELLSGQGYQTAASVSAFVTTRIWNLDQGFDAYMDTVGAPGDKDRGRWSQERPANEVVDDALAWLAKTDPKKPYFLWVHVYDPHHPYNPPPAWKEKLPNRPYAAEVGFVDEQLARLKAAADAQARAGGVAWMAIADHGEAVREEHGESTHGVFLFEGTTHIPFIVRPAKPLAEPVVITDAVSGVDVMPTALGLLGLTPPADLDGHDLSPFARGQKVERGGVYLESYTVTQRFGYHPEIAAVEGPLKLMNTPSPRLFDVVADPGELTNLVEQRPDDVARLKKVTEAVEARAVESEASNLTPEAIEQLAALGYMGAGTGFSTQERSTVDAKDRMETIAGIEKARAMSAQPEKLTEAEALFRDILKREPQLGEARLGLSRILQRTNRLDEAEQVLRDALAQEPGSTVLHLNLAALLMRKHDAEGALREFEAIVALVPSDDGGRGGVIRTLAMLGREREALTRAEAWLAEDPTNQNMQGYVGVLLLGLDDVTRAEPLLRSAAADGVPRERVYEGLSRIESARGNLPLATEYLQRELDAFPQNPFARMALTRMYMSQKKWDEAAAEAGFVVDRFPDNPEAALIQAQAIFNLGDFDLAKTTLAPAFKRWPQDPDIVLLQANILAKLGDMEEGEKLHKRAVELERARRETSGPRRR